MTTCRHFKPRSLSDPEVCCYWEDRNPHFPEYCKHPAVMACETRGLKYTPRMAMV
jgi:hypothetical protein